jgi:hypothetical protein
MAGDMAPRRPGLVRLPISAHATIFGLYPPVSCSTGTDDAAVTASSPTSSRALRTG